MDRDAGLAALIDGLRAGLMPALPLRRFLVTATPCRGNARSILAALCQPNVCRHIAVAWGYS